MESWWRMSNDNLIIRLGKPMALTHMAQVGERERFTTSIQPAWLMRTGLCSCLSLLQQGNETLADRLLVLVPHEHTHAPRSILEQARKLGSDVTGIRAIKHAMELIAHSLCIANSAPAKVAREGWPGKTALLNGQRYFSNPQSCSFCQWNIQTWPNVVVMLSMLLQNVI